MISRHLLNLNIFIKLKALLNHYPFDVDRVRSAQFKRLKKLLIYSYHKFEFYRERFDQAGFNPNTFRDLEEMEKIPPLEKSEYREFTSRQLQKQLHVYKKHYQDGTSGSTGEPLKICRTWNERAYMLAKFLRALILNGYRFRDKTFCLPSPHRIAKTDSMMQKMGFLRRDAVAYTEPVEKMVEGYIRSRADLLYANKSQLVLMARYITENNIKIRQPRLINCSGEVLDHQSKQIIERVFGPGRLFEVYGAVEFNNLAFQILGESVFRFNHDTNLLELVDDRGSITSERGWCVVTDFNIYSFPLIRYKLNDWIEKDNRDGLGVITRIVGREDDWVRLKDGTRIPFHPFYEVMEKRPIVRQFRVIQLSEKLINVNVVLKREIDKNGFEKALIEDFKKEITDLIEYKINFVDQIPPDPSGKLRMLVSELN